MDLGKLSLLSRRQLIQSSLATQAVRVANAAGRNATLPDPSKRNSDSYWNQLREEQFLLPKERIFLNTGTLGVAPRSVVDATNAYMTNAAELSVDWPPRWGGEPIDGLRTALSRFVGCEEQELALTHNTTEAMNTIANGLDLKAGDEVVLTDQEHPGGSCCWYQKEARFGIKVRQAKISLPPKSAQEVADSVVSMFNSQTRVVSFSGITTTTGLKLPIRSIADQARAKGIISVVDAAHLPGQIPMNIKELGCDYLAASPHKWMLTPAGCGFLYGRGEMLERLWANVAGYTWNKRKMNAARFMWV